MIVGLGLLINYPIAGNTCLRTLLVSVKAALSDAVPIYFVLTLLNSPIFVETPAIAK